MVTYSEIITEYPGRKEEFEERAGIMEFDGGMERTAAEAATVELMKSKGYLFFKQNSLFREAQDV